MNSGVFDGDDEGRALRLSSSFVASQFWVCVPDQETDDEYRKDVELVIVSNERSVASRYPLTSPIRQNTFFIALGMSLLGSLCSAAVMPTISVPL